MTIDDLNRYSLRLTETYQRFYNTSQPTMTRTETTDYPLHKGTELYTSCGFLAITGYLGSDGNITGIRIDYYDNDGLPQTAQVTRENAAHIRLIEGEGNVYRISDCTFRIVPKED